MMSAVLSNPSHPEYGVATIPFPIPRDQYAHCMELFELNDLINLTFCCQQATVITDFSDLAAIGRDHYMNLHGGSASVNALDGKGTARQLIESGSGTVTPYGVVYDNGMKLEQVYISMEEMMNGSQSNHMVMGGLSR